MKVNISKVPQMSMDDLNKLSDAESEAYFRKCHRPKKKGVCCTEHMGTICYWKDGKLHADNHPAVADLKTQLRMWYHNGILHRTGEWPAVTDSHGNQFFWTNGSRPMGIVAIMMDGLLLEHIVDDEGNHKIIEHIPVVPEQAIVTA